MIRKIYIFRSTSLLIFDCTICKNTFTTHFSFQMKRVKTRIYNYFIVHRDYYSKLKHKKTKCSPHSTDTVLITVSAIVMQIRYTTTMEKENFVVKMIYSSLQQAISPSLTIAEGNKAR